MVIVFYVVCSVVLVTSFTVTCYLSLKVTCYCYLLQILKSNMLLLLVTCNMFLFCYVQSCIQTVVGLYEKF